MPAHVAVVKYGSLTASQRKAHAPCPDPPHLLGLVAGLPGLGLGDGAAAGRPAAGLVQRRQCALPRALPQHAARTSASRGACGREGLPACDAGAGLATARAHRDRGLQRVRHCQRLHHTAALQPDRGLPDPARRRRTAGQQRLAGPAAGARVHPCRAPGQGAWRAARAAGHLRQCALVHSQPLPARLDGRRPGGVERERSRHRPRPPARPLVRGLAAQRARARFHCAG